MSSYKRHLTSSEKKLPEAKSKREKHNSPTVVRNMNPEFEQADASPKLSDQCKQNQIAANQNMEADGISKILARLDSLDAIAIEIKKLSNIEHTIQSMNNAMMEYKNDLQILSNELGEACEEIVVLKSRLDLAESENDRLKSKIDRLESKENSDVLLIFGLPEQKGEDCYKTAKDYFGSLSLGDLVLRSSYRRGKFNPAYKHPRPLVVKFLCEQDKTTVIKSQNKGRKATYVKAYLSPKAACVQAK